MSADYPTAGMTDCTWFLAMARGQHAHTYLVPLCREMANRQATLRDNTKKCIAVFQYGGDAKDIEPTDTAPLEETALCYNAAQNTVETVHSKVCKPRIAPMPLTNGGGYLARHRAREIGKAIEAVLDENQCDAIEEDVVMDALVSDHGAGAAMVIDREDDVLIEHVPIEDVWYDEAEIRRRQPRSQYLVPTDGMDVFKCIELYAKPGDTHPGLVGTVEERREAILKACNKPEAWRAKATEAAKHRVDIYEAWHLKSGCEETEEEDEETGEKRKVVKHDGRHVICVDGATLLDEPWEEDHFPILLYVPRKRRRSIWGLSLMRSLVAPQREYEKGTKKIQHQHQKMGVSGFIAPKTANLNIREITSGTFGAGFVAEFDGQAPPVPFVPEPVAQGTYAYVEGIPRNMMERNGVSTLSASSQLPAGLQQASGKALQVFEDFESERLLPYHRERERFKIGLAWLVVHAAARVVARKGTYKAKYRGKHGLETLDWKEFIEDKDNLDIRVFPTSQLAKQPAAKFAQLTELLNAQAITVEQFKRLFELPDLEAENQLDTADTDVIDRNLDIMVTTGRYIAPDSFDNLELVIQRTGKFINLCRQQEVPEARLKLLHDHITDAKSLIDQAKAKAAAEAAANAPPPMPGAAPPGAPPMDPGAPPMPPGPPMPMAA
jgi:hypothetical protein